MQVLPPISPRTLVRGIIWVNSLVFVTALIFSGPIKGITLNPFHALAPSADALHFLGASGRIPIDRFHAWWSLLTATWLHGSLLHILFNMMAVRTVAPYVIREYGCYRMFVIYALSGAAGFLFSYLGGVPLTIGASAAICGLIGALFYFGKSRGGQWGQLVLKQTSGWIVSLVLFGFIVPNIDNWGHGGGFLAGILLGALFRYEEKRAESLVDRLLGAGLGLLTLSLLILVIAEGIRLKFF